jgi:hypothetical protein
MLQGVFGTADPALLVTVLPGPFNYPLEIIPLLLTQILLLWATLPGVCLAQIDKRFGLR